TTCYPEMILNDDKANSEMNSQVIVFVKDNDSGITEGSELTAPSTTTIGGTITVNTDGSVTYTPPTDYIGEDTFDYTITTTDGRIDSATVTITVLAPADLAIEAVNDEFDIFNDEDAIGSITVNDLNNYGEIVVNTTPVVSPLNGSVIINPDGTIVYTPDADFSGTDSFSYQICNSIESTICSEAVVTINVTGSDTLIIDPRSTVGCELFIPNGFSPNDDNINDYFEISYYNESGAECVTFGERHPNARVEIYNRWGNLVFEKEGFGNIDRWGGISAWWDGRSTNGWTVGKDMLPAGTYFFTLDFNDGNTEPRAGSIFLNR
ncbi:MAG TPA: Ig-like domain-containing protein, partial [Draconibacterium sp.]|nr:Ig-like domain-containing protein [Draconibacterium sp.]